MIKVRKAKEGDLNQIIDLRLELVKTYSHAYLSTCEELERQTMAEWRAWFSKYLRGDPANFLVAENKGRLVGMVACKGAGWKRAAHVGTVLALGVLPSAAGRGAGQALVKKLVAWARKETDIRRLQLDVYTDNKKAISLYRKLGFKKEGLKRKYAKKKDGTYQDSLTMVFFL